MSHQEQQCQDAIDMKCLWSAANCELNKGEDHQQVHPLHEELRRAEYGNSVETSEGNNGNNSHDILVYPKEFQDVTSTYKRENLFLKATCTVHVILQ